MNSSNTARYQIHPSNDDKVNIHVVAEVVRASTIDEQSPNQPPVPPVEVFTTTVSNVSEWSVAETIHKSSTLYSVGVEKISSNFGVDRPPVAVKNSELP